jgi:UPF0271 protein
MTVLINLNADMAEGFGAYDIGNDDEILKIIRSANVACGMHAGDPRVMHRVVKRAAEEGVSIGAHPGFNDIWGFGRRQIQMNTKDLEYMISYQIGALNGIAAQFGMKVTHVKPHGALNNMAHVDPEYASAIARGIKAVDRDIIFVANVLSEMVKAGREAGLKVALEAYVDRTYDDTGAMTSRKFPDAMIHDAEQATKQVLSFLNEGAVISKSGKKFPTKIHTFCCHGDEPTGVEVVGKVKKALEKQGVKFKTLPEMDLS